MTTEIDTLARSLGLTTADRLEERVANDEPETADRVGRWTAEMAEAFKAMAPAAVYVAGNEGPEPRYFGDNQGAWPILLGITRTWRDTITPQMDRLSPLRQRGVLFRVWTPSHDDARRLVAGIEGLIRDRVEQLRGSWLDFGPQTDVPYFEAECHALGKRLGIARTWDDEDMLLHVRRSADDRARAAAEWNGRGK